MKPTGLIRIVENFSSIALHNSCKIRDYFMLIFHKLKLVPQANFSTLHFSNAVDTVDVILVPQIVQIISTDSCANPLQILVSKILLWLCCSLGCTNSWLQKGKLSATPKNSLVNPLWLLVKPPRSRLSTSIGFSQTNSCNQPTT